MCKGLQQDRDSPCKEFQGLHAHCGMGHDVPCDMGHDEALVDDRVLVHGKLELEDGKVQVHGRLELEDGMALAHGKLVLVEHKEQVQAHDIQEQEEHREQEQGHMAPAHGRIWEESRVQEVSKVLLELVSRQRLLHQSA